MPIETRVIFNTRTEEFFDIEDAVLVESEWPLNYEAIRESGTDIRTLGKAIPLDDPAVHIVRDNAAGDGHDHAVMFVDKGVRHRLSDFLMRPELRGWGYSKFLTMSLSWAETQIAECNGDGSGHCYTHDGDGLLDTEDEETGEPLVGNHCNQWGFPGVTDTLKG